MEYNLSLTRHFLFATLLLILLQERLVLAIFFYSTGGDQWESSNQWLTRSHHSYWRGVTTDSSTNYVKKLDLRDNALFGTIPAEIGHLTSLTWLNLRDNDLSGSIPAEIGDLTSLTHLYLNRNDLTGSIPAGVCDLPSAFLHADCKNCNQSNKPFCCSKCD